MRTPLRALLIAVLGVGVIDYFSHLVFSNPMETTSYFLAKMTLYFVFSLVALYYVKFQNHEFLKVTVAGITVALMWGAYYNVLPVIFDFYPFGIPLRALSFLGMGLLGTGLAFGIVHTLAFVGGYYATKKLR
jgi:hypothetical protein